jgi:glycosyltransferase involved in cell wall biosynthesis
MYPYKKIISVVISSYNAQKTLQAALDALENQDIEKEKFEVIIVDDGSNDCSKQLIDKYIQKNTFTLKYFYQKNQ